MLVGAQANRHGQEVHVPSLSDAVRRIKGDLAAALPEALLTRLLADHDYHGRNRILTPVVTTYLAMQRALGNASISELRHLSGLDFAPSAYCQAVLRLPVGYFAALARAVVGGLQATDSGADHSWCGHRLFLIDGTGVSMPDTPALQAKFGQPGGQKPGCGFPVAHLLVQFAAHSGYLLKVAISPLRTHDLAHAATMHRDLQDGDIIVGDRAFGSFAHLALLRQRRLHGVFRAHQRRLVHQQKNHRDRLIKYDKPQRKPNWMSTAEFAALPVELIVREVTVRVNSPGGRVHHLVLVTTLLDKKRYPAEMTARMYETRWRAEVNIRHLKITLGMEVLKSQTVDGVIKEIHAFTIIYNLVRRVMHAAGRRQQVAIDRISFVDALRWLRQADPDEPLIDLVVHPLRPDRHEPRVRKRRPKQLHFMKQPRAVLKKLLLSKPNEA